MTRAKGLHPSPLHKKMQLVGRDLHPTSAALGFAPASSLRPFKPATSFDQGRTSTCFAHMMATLIYVAMALEAAASGRAPEFVPSPLGIARETYCEEQPGPGPLEDVGASLADLMIAVGRVGVRPMSELALAPGRYSDVTSDNVTRRPTLGEDLASAHHLVFGPEHLDAAVDDFEAQVAFAIDILKVGVGLGIHSVPGFDYWKAGDPPLDDASGIVDNDGHAVVCLEYRTESDGSLSFLLDSSWSDTFGEHGGAWVRGRCLRKLCFEAWRCRVTMRDAGAAS